MKITAIETLRLEEFGNLLWVFLETDEGLVGLGETFFGPQAVEAWIHETAAPLVLGQDPLRVTYLHKKMQGYCGVRGSGAEMRGVSAIDVALWDLWGKITGQPIYQLLGGLTRDSVRTYNTCAGYQYIRSNKGQLSENWGTGAEQGPYEDLDGFLNRAGELAESLLEQGITGMKIWPLDKYAEASGGLDISAPDLRRGLEPFAKIRSAVGDKMDIMLECHSLWNLPTAVKISRALEEFDPFWIEDPIRMDRLATIGEFKAQTRCPVTASETIAGRWGFSDLIEAKAVDIVMLDIGWVGGITEAHAIAQLAAAHHLPFAPHDCTGPVIYTAATHMSVHEPNALIQESVRAFYNGGWFSEVATALPIMENGYVRPPDGAGLGMELLPDLSKRPDAVVRRSRESGIN
ncbi:MAG: mandelate racemase/muconate lactonizing enzyme family protein [Desulfocapsaceae bacterium]